MISVGWLLLEASLFIVLAHHLARQHIEGVNQPQIEILGGETCAYTEGVQISSHYARNSKGEQRFTSRFHCTP